MKSRKILPVLFAVAVFMLASLACKALTPTPTASDFYMATDENGNNQTNTFSSNDVFYVFFSVSGIEAGTPFEARWYALDVSGQDANTPFQTTDYNYESSVTKIYFQLSNDSGWPSGHYRVDIYMNGTKVGEQSFTVQ